MSSQDQHSLPENLVAQLDEFRAHLWRRKFVEAGISAVFGLLAGYLIVFALDRFVDLSSWVRFGILIASLTGALIIVPRVLSRWVWKHRSLEQIAKLIRQHDPHFGDRLLGVVELQSQHEDASTLSTTLKNAAIEQLAEETSERDLDEALPRKAPTALLWGAGLAVVGTVVSIFWSTGAASSSLVRWLAPFSDTERFTFTKLEDVPSSMIVAYGEPFNLSVSLAGDSEQTPDIASAVVGRDEPFTTERRLKTYTFRFNGLTSATEIDLEIGDARRTLSVQPMTRPAVESIHADIELPAYLGYPAERVDLTNGSLSALEGSRVHVAGLASRDLEEVGAVNGNDESLRVAIEGKTFTVSEPLITPTVTQVEVAADEAIAEDGPEPEPQHAGLLLSFTDKLGLGSKEEFEITLNGLADAAPTIFIEGETQHVILVDEDLELRVNSSDDFGVREVGLIWEAADERASQGSADGVTLKQGHQRRRNLEVPYMFSPNDLELGPQRINLRAYATDYLPGRERQYSEPIQIVVLSHEEHALFVKERFGALMDELEELSRSEEASLEENKRIDDLTPKDMAAPEVMERIDSQLKEELMAEEQMKTLEENSRELFKDALRNKTIKPEALQQWSEMNNELKELGEKAIPEVSEELEKSGDPSKSNSERDDAAHKTVEKQKEVLEKMKEALEKANKTEEKLEAAGFVARLRAAAKQNREIASAMVQVLTTSLTSDGASSSAGADASDLAKDLFLQLVDGSKLQGKVQRSVGLIEDDLGHFARRTKQEDYGTIQEEMRAAQIRTALNTLKGRIVENKLGTSVPEIRNWADRLDGWADLIDPNKKDDGQGEGGEGSAPSGDPDLARIELMIELMRMVQEEQDIRAKTRYLDNAKDPREDGETRPAEQPDLPSESAPADLPKPKAPRRPA